MGYQYKLKRMGGNSSKFGRCDVCGEFADTVYYQSEWVEFEDGGMIFLTSAGASDPIWGHKECLISQRR